MKKEIKKAKFFYSADLNQQKFDVILNKAKEIREFKNKISNEIHGSILQYLDQTRFDVIKKFNCKIDNLNGQDIQNAITDVWSNYSTMIDSIKFCLSFKVAKRKSTKLSMVLSFLAKYGYEGISNNLIIPINDPKKAKFFQEVKNYCEKFGEERLLKLALLKRKRIIKLKLKLIEYKNLSFRTITRINSDIFDFNLNKNSIFNGFINLGGYVNYKKLSIPTKHNLSYHGNRSRYSGSKGSQNSQSYQITIINEKKKLIRIAYLVDDVLEIPDENQSFLGVDTNVKRNLFSTEIGNIDFDRKLLNEYVKFLKKIDNRKSKELSKKRRASYSRWRLKIKNEIKHRMNDLIKLAKENGRNHLILEDLSLLKSLRIPSEFGINYGRLVRLLGLISIKKELEQMCRNQKILISFVQAEFSSQTCNKCGHISKENRKNQSEFICASCGHSEDADINSSRNLQYRVSSDVLKETLLDKNELNEFRPKSLKLYEIRSAILNSYQHQSMPET